MVNKLVLPTIGRPTIAVFIYLIAHNAARRELSLWRGARPALCAPLEGNIHQREDFLENFLGGVGRPLPYARARIKHHAVREHRYYHALHVVRNDVIAAFDR